MDSLSYRKARSSSAGDEPVRAQSHGIADSVEFEEPTTAQTMHPPHKRQSSSVAASRASKSATARSGKMVWIVAGVVGGVAALYFLLSMLGVLGGSKITPLVDSSKYQAIYLTNGSAYYGKITQSTDEYIQLSNVYYVRNKSKSGDAATDQKKTDTEYELVKPSEVDLVQPDDVMVIRKQQVLYYVNLKSDSKAVKLIEQNQQKK